MMNPFKQVGRAVGKMPGMNKLTGAVNKAPGMQKVMNAPGVGAMGRGLGIGPSAPPMQPPPQNQALGPNPNQALGPQPQPMPPPDMPMSPPPAQPMQQPALGGIGPDPNKMQAMMAMRARMRPPMMR